MSMLKQTKEYKDFAGYVDDCGGNVRTVNGDTEEWIPEEAYTTAHDFRKKYGQELTPELVNVVLSDLNKIWKESIRKQMNRVKNQWKEEVN